MGRFPGITWNPELELSVLQEMDSAAPVTGNRGCCCCCLGASSALPSWTHHPQPWGFPSQAGAAHTRPSELCVPLTGLGDQEGAGTAVGITEPGNHRLVWAGMDLTDHAQGSRRHQEEEWQRPAVGRECSCPSLCCLCGGWTKTKGVSKFSHPPNTAVSKASPLIRNSKGKGNQSLQSTGTCGHCPVFDELFLTSLSPGFCLESFGSSSNKYQNQTKR